MIIVIGLLVSFAGFWPLFFDHDNGLLEVLRVLGGLIFGYGLAAHFLS